MQFYNGRGNPPVAAILKETGWLSPFPFGVEA